MQRAAVLDRGHRQDHLEAEPETANTTRTKIRIDPGDGRVGRSAGEHGLELGRAGGRGQDDRQDEHQRDHEQQDRRERRKQALEAVGDRLARRWSPDPARAASPRSGRPARRARRSWPAPASTMAAPRPTDWAAGRINSGDRLRQQHSGQGDGADQPAVAGKDVAWSRPMPSKSTMWSSGSPFACASLMRISGRAWKSLATSNGA